MINMIYKNGKDLKEPEGKYLIWLPKEIAFEADSFKELTAIICGLKYQDCEMAETALMMRIDAAKNLGMAEMAKNEVTFVIDGVNENEIDENANMKETIIVYHEVIGKIPYSYSDAEVDYEIHGTSKLIRVECDETFIFSLIQRDMITVHEKTDTGEYANIKGLYDLELLLNERLVPFKEKAKTENVPLHERFS